MTKRCAIYTRKSTEEGLDQAFNSLDAQREACEAYIASQKGEGWKLIKTRFDDGGISGGHMERPALQALLVEIDAGRVDIIVVYKVDRLTRSLADFAKLVERFDAKGVSFVSVTQAFNTSNSMGRLTLNVLLSFAQFEREVTAERIRDKIAASRKKGMWTGGLAPLGYDNIDKRLVVNENEAKIVRRLLSLYLETGGVRLVIETANREGLTTKARANGTGGRALTRGPLYYILSNPLYVGLVRAGKELHPGEHDAIIDRETWDAVQAKLRETSQRAGTKSAARNPFVGKLYAEGNRLTPSHASKQGRRYRYYVTHAADAGPATANDRWRLNAGALEGSILKAIDEWLTSPRAASMLLNQDARASDLQKAQSVLDALRESEMTTLAPARLQDWAARLDRVDINETGVSIAFEPARLLPETLPLAEECIVRSVVPFGRRGHGQKIIVGETKETALPDATALGLIKRAVEWRDRWFNDPSLTLAEIAREDSADAGDTSRHLRLAFLAPDIVKALLDGTAPKALSAERLRRLDELPASWSVQRRLFGLPNPQ
ncbi:MAG: recombinase family protein [Parvularculaceae bacterium]